MNKFKISFLITAILAITEKQEQAGTSGYADSKKIENNYNYAQKAYKDIDSKV